MSTVIKQIVQGGGDSQTIKMVVRDNERGPRGFQGERGIPGPRGLPGPRGFDGAIQYRAGTGINITDDNIIQATGGSIAEWGGLQGNIQNQTDLQQEFGEYTKTANLGAVALSNSYTDLSNKPAINNATLTIQNDGTSVGTFTANSSTNTTANIVPPVKVGSVVDAQKSTVQLADKDNTNIYPISNSLSNDTVTTSSIQNNAVTASKIDFTTLLTSGVTFQLKDGTNSTYSDSHSNNWYGYNFTNGTVAGACTRYNGASTMDGVGGGAQLTSAAPKGLYLITAEINNNGEGSVDGYRPFRICKNSDALTGDVGVPYRGGSGSTTVVVELEPGDVVNFQIYQQNSNRTIVARVWLRGYFLRPTN